MGLELKGTFGRAGSQPTRGALLREKSQEERLSWKRRREGRYQVRMVSLVCVLSVGKAIHALFPSMLLKSAMILIAYQECRIQTNKQTRRLEFHAV